MLIQQKQIENDNIDFSDFEEELKELAEQEKHQSKKPVTIKKVAPKRNNNMINELLAKKLKQEVQTKLEQNQKEHQK